jgi:hypothetical protein
MGWNTTNNPKLFVPPPFINPNTTPPHLQNTGCKDGKKERNKPYTCDVTNLQQNKSSKRKLVDAKDTAIGNLLQVTHR